jgi:hypothetical protein
MGTAQDLCPMGPHSGLRVHHRLRLPCRLVHRLAASIKPIYPERLIYAVFFDSIRGRPGWDKFWFAISTTV